MEENFPLWVGVIALVFIIYAFLKFREISFAQQQKYVMKKKIPNDFHNWITKNLKIIEWLLIPKLLKHEHLLRLFLR